MPQHDHASIDKFRKAYGQIIAKSWTDPAFASRLQRDPRTVLKEHGIDVPDGVEVRVVHSAPNEVHMPLPAKPSGELDDEHLKNVAGGYCVGTAGSIGTAGCPVSTAGSLFTAGSAGSDAR
jgi:hypothetical protein